MYKYSRVVSLFFLGGLLASCHFGPMQVVTDEEVSFDGIREVSVRGGSLEVSYTGSESVQDVTISAFLESTDGSIDGITYRNRGDRLEINIPQSENSLSFWTGKTKGYVHITGPQEMRLDMKGSSGILEIAHIRGDEFDFSISSGRMEIRDVTCDKLRLSCSSGKLEATNISGDIDVKLSSGYAAVRRVKGDVAFSGSSGKLDISHVQGFVSGKMSSGKADLEDIWELGEVAVSSGMLTATKVGLGENSNLSVSSGFMKVRTNSDLNDFNIDFGVGSGHLTVGTESGSKDIRIERDAEHTVRGRVQSGKLELTEY